MSEQKFTVLGELDTSGFKQGIEAMKQMDDSSKDLKKNLESAFDGASDGANKAEKDLKEYISVTDKLIKKEGELEKAIKEVDKARKKSTDPKEVKKLSAIYNTLNKDLGKVKGGLKDIKKETNEVSKSGGKFKGLGKDLAVAFAPLLAIGTAKQLIANVIESTDRVIKFQSETQRLTGLQGSGLREVVSETQAIAKTFDKDYREVLIAAKDLSDDFGISQIESLKLVEKGFLSGADYAGDFLENIKEISPEIKGMSGSAEDLVNILVKGQRDGIFNKEGIKIAKEFGDNITKQSKNTADSIKSLLGKERGDELLGGIRDGSITQIDALAEVSTALGDTSKDSTLLQNAVEGIFGETGERAGLEYLQTLKDIDQGTEGLIDTTDKLSVLQQEQLDNNRQIIDSEQNLADSFEDYGNIFETVKTNIVSGWNNILAAINTAASGQAGFFEALEIQAAITAGRKQNSLDFDDDKNQFDAYAESIKTENEDLLKEGIIDEKEYSKRKNEVRLRAKRLLDSDLLATEQILQDRLEDAKNSGDKSEAARTEVELENFKERRIGIEGYINAIEKKSEKSSGTKSLTKNEKIEADKRQKQLDKELSDRLKRQEKFYNQLEDVELNARKTSIDNLQGEEKINAEADLQQELLGVYAQSLVDELNELELSGEEKKEAIASIGDSILTLQMDIENKRTEEITGLQKTNSDKEFTQAQELELANTEKLLAEKESQFSNEEAFEEYKQETLNNIKLKQAEDQLARLGGDLDAEGELTKVKLQTLITELENDIAEFNKPKTGIESLKDKLGLSDDDIAQAKEGFSLFSDAYNELLQGQIDKNQELVDSIDDKIDAQQGLVDAEKTLLEDGKANSLAVEQLKLDGLKQQREAALKEQDKLRKKQALLELAAQTGSLITASAQYFKEGSKFGITGVIVAAGLITSMFAAFKKFQAQSKSAVKLKKGGSGDYFGMITGKTHEQGGEDFLSQVEVEKGEKWAVLSNSKVGKYGSAFDTMTRAFNEDRPELLKGILPPSFGFNPIREVKTIRGTHVSGNAMIQEIQTLNNKVDLLTKELANRPHYMPLQEGQTFRKISKGRTEVVKT